MSSDEEPPMYRLEHSVSDKAGCQQKSCKDSKVKIAKGELRLGVYAWYAPGEEFITTWKHWHCVLSRQLKNIKALAEDDPEKLTGFHNISTESQEQVKQAFENNAVDKEWSDVRTDLIKKGSGHVGEITNATSYKVDVATRCTAMCRNTACKDKGVKIKKGELRLGIATMYDGHESWGYKHWYCMSAYDLNAAKERMEEDAFDGIDQLPDEFKTTVLDSFKQGEALEPPVLEAIKETKTRKPRTKKAKVDTTEDAAEPTIAGVKRPADEDEAAGEDVVPKKKRGRASKNAMALPPEQQGPIEPPSEPTSFAQFYSKPKPNEEVDPTVARIQAMADEMREKAGQTTSNGA